MKVGANLVEIYRKLIPEVQVLRFFAYLKQIFSLQGKDFRKKTVILRAISRQFSPDAGRDTAERGPRYRGAQAKIPRSTRQSTAKPERGCRTV